MAASALLLPPTTPPDYHRLVSPTLTIPSDHKFTIPVGLLSCQRDPLLRNLSTTIISAQIYKPPAAPSGGGKKAHQKQAKATAEPILASPCLQVVLHDTVLFPESGGQPSDVGVIVSDDGRVWEVALIKRHGLTAVHYVKLPFDASTEAIPSAFESGRKVSVELGEEGFKRRLDHMSMHTVQHLLSAVLESHLSLPTLAWSLTAYPSPSYIDLPRALTPEETTLIQDECNRYVFEGRRVHIEVQELQSDQKGIPSSSPSDTPANREFGRGLPSDYVGGGGVHRVVVIDGVDRNPCCGTHLPTLSSLQLYLLPPPAGGSSAPVRHYFLSGPRLLNHLGTVQSLLTRTAGLLSCGTVEAPDRVALVVEESKKREKRMDDVEKELADAIGRQLVDEMIGWEKSEDNVNSSSGKEWTKFIGRTDDSPTSTLPFLQAITFAFLAHLPSGEGESHKYTILLTSSPSSQTTSSTTVVMVFGSDDKRVKEVGEELKRQFKSLKGGGKGVRWSGKLTGVWLADREGKAAALALTQSSSA